MNTWAAPLQKIDEITYISWDPGKGRKNTIGCCTWDKDGKHIDVRQYTYDEMCEALEQLPKNITAFIIEDYIVNPAVAHGGSKVETARVIGVLQYWARQNGVDTVYFQRSSILPIAEKHSGVKLPKNHDHSHGISAYLHGYEYLLSVRHIIKPRVLES